MYFRIFFADCKGTHNFRYINEFSTFFCTIPGPGAAAENPATTRLTAFPVPEAAAGPHLRKPVL